ncbi:hypothetical protein MUN84_19990 [Hymenobacter sp. 5516J-16]|uniref:hypothetical protein n=1 Tax=Hymenobacter sp. 5516J-16 TaxID=2932253 RepID=UPI001FD3C11E|nr:hypothetical protein [Hymenobacter sp. 5516J-16]UOQ76762.1 hypothetical protein MUN84_19990 [Hymenobacter sp. 5516J-16]
MLLTLLLSETTAISLFFSALLVLFALVLLVPVLLLSRTKSSGTAKLLALGLAVVPIWLGSGLNNDFAYMEYAWLVPFFSYLPLGGVLVNLMRSALK